MAALVWGGLLRQQVPVMPRFTVLPAVTADQARALVTPEIRGLRVLMALTALVAEQATLVQVQVLATLALLR
jgi:hypothetical protein